jgi:hypothetical protein
VYGFEDLDGLQDAWLDYLKKPASVIHLSGKKPEIAPKKDKSSNLIPPTPLPQAYDPQR